MRMVAQAPRKAAGVPSAHEARRASSPNDHEDASCSVFGIDMKQLSHCRGSGYAVDAASRYLFNGYGGASPLGRGADGKLHVPRHIAGHIDAGNARPAIRIADKTALLVVSAPKRLQQGEHGV